MALIGQEMWHSADKRSMGYEGHDQAPVRIGGTLPFLG